MTLLRHIQRSLHRSETKEQYILSDLVKILKVETLRVSYDMVDISGTFMALILQ